MQIPNITAHPAACTFEVTPRYGPGYDYFPRSI